MPKQAAAPVWHVYMIECAGGRLYTGITPDVQARFLKHCAGRGAAFTRINKPLRILAAQACGTRGEALRREHALKRLNRTAKLAWVKDVSGVDLAATPLTGRRQPGPPARSVLRII